MNGLKTSRFLAMLLTALVAGTTFSHFLELPGKLQVTAEQWLFYQQNVYSPFATLSGLIELAAILMTIWLVIGLRHRGPELMWPVTALICLLVAFFVLWVGEVNPVNMQITQWTADTIPKNWETWRARWEYSHALRFVFHLSALGALYVSTLIQPHHNTYRFDVEILTRASY